MSVDKTNQDTDDLEAAKKEADELGLLYHPRIGLKKLQKQIDEKKIEIGSSPEDSQEDNPELDELKIYAVDIGVAFSDDIDLAELEILVQKKEDEIASAAKAKKEVAKEIKSNKVKIIVESREGDDAPPDQFFGFHSMKTGIKETILIQFGEEIEVSEAMYNHIKSITFGERKFNMVNDENGIPKKVWYTKKKTRFIVSKV